MSFIDGMGDERNETFREYIKDWYHVPLLFAVVTTMFVIRIQSYSNFIRGNQIYLSGNDAWYHLREVTYITQNWPSPIPFDPWTGFPYGKWVGQFGTLYDQVIATIALLLGGGSPSQILIGKILLLAPAAAGALAAIPVYFIGKSLSGRVAGLFGAAVLMLLPGTFLNRTLVGVADHNAVEPLMMTIAVGVLVIALQKAQTAMPIWEVISEELLSAREIDSIGEPLFWSILSGVSISLYLLVWPPGVFIIGVVGVFTIIKLSSDVVTEQTPEPTAFVIVVSMVTTVVMSSIAIDRISIDVTSLSLLQPLTALGVATSAIILCWLARLWESTDVDRSLFPVIVAALGVGGIILSALFGFGLFDLVTGNLLRIAGFSAGANARTVGEAQPFVSQGSLR